jgi:hypothetical protein
MELREGCVAVVTGGGSQTRLGQSGRHRPEALGGPTVDTAAAGVTGQAAAAGLDFMSPLEAGRKVVAGIRANRAYIAVDPRRKSAPEQRFGGILADSTLRARRTGPGRRRRGAEASGTSAAWARPPAAAPPRAAGPSRPTRLRCARCLDNIELSNI